MPKKIQATELTADFRLGVAKLSQDTREATRALKTIDNSISEIGKSLKTVFGVGIAAGIITQFDSIAAAIGKIANPLGELAKKGAAVSDISDNFKALGGSVSSIEEARKAVLGTVSAFDLMKVANLGLIRTIPGFNENFGKMAEFAKRFAAATGQDTQQVLSDLTDALAKGKSKGLEPFGAALDSTANKARTQAEFLSQLPQLINGLAQPFDSVAEAQEALGKSFDDMLTRMGMGVNGSDALTVAYRELTAEIDKADFKELGKDLATIFSAFVDLATIAIPPVITAINKLASAYGYLTQSTNEGLLAGFQGKLDEVQSKLKGLRDNPIQASNYSMDGYSKESPLIKNLEKEEANLERNIRNLSKIRHDGFVNDAKLEEESAKKSASVREKIEKDRERSSLSSTKESAGKKAQATIDALNKELDSFDSKAITDKLTEAIKLGDNSGFESALKDYKEQVEQSILDGHKDALSLGGETAQKVKDFAKQSAQVQADEYFEKMSEAEKKRADEQVKLQAEAHKKSVDLFRNLFENAITGVTFDLEDALKQAAVGFAAEVAAQLTKGIGGVFDGANSPQDVGGNIAKSILGSISGPDGKLDLNGIYDGLFGNAPADGMGPVKPGAVSEIFSGANTSGAYLTAAIASLEALKGIGKSGPQTAKGIGTAAGSAIGAYFGGPIGAQIGSVIGKAAGKGISHALGLGGPTNKETKARIEFAEKLEGMIDEIGGLKIFGADGALKNITDIKVGSSSKFNDPNWTSGLDKLGPQARSIFDSLGKGLEGILGITEKVGGQMGLILAESLGGSIDNARLAVFQLGLSLEDFQKVFEAQAEKGVIRWAEYNSQIAAIGEAFKPGLAAVGATKSAFDNLINSGGRGLAAVKSIKDTAVEGLEAGLETIGQLGDKLLAEGADPEKVKALIDSAAARGVDKLKQLSELTNVEAGSIVGGMESISKSLEAMWTDMGKRIDDLNTKLESIPKDITSTFHLQAEIDPRIEKLLDSQQLDLNGGSVPTSDVTNFARGGVISRPSYFMNGKELSRAGESGMEAILPLARVNGKLGVASHKSSAGLGGNSIHINVDARGAEVGVEHKVAAVIQEMAPMIADYVYEHSMQRSRRSAV